MKLQTKLPLFLFICFANSSLIIRAEDTPNIKVIPITTTKVIQSTMIETTLVRGEIESPSTPHTAAKVAAEVSSIKVDDGVLVVKGQLLAELDDEAFKIAAEKANADIQRSQALLTNQIKEVTRNKELFTKKLISQSLVDNSLTALKQLQAELLGAKARLKEANYQLSHTKIISPVNGIIQQRMVSQGDYVKVGNPMFYIVSLDNLRARIYLPDTLGSIIPLGLAAELNQNGQTVIGSITQMRPMMENGNRALHALVKFENKNHWKPGASITAKLVLKEHKDTLVVPSKTIVYRPKGTVIYQIEGNKAVERSVTVGLRQGSQVEITASEFSVGDQIALDGAAWLTNGTQVDIQAASR